MRLLDGSECASLFMHVLSIYIRLKSIEMYDKMAFFCEWPLINVKKNKKTQVFCEIQDTKIAGKLPQK